MRIVSTRIIKTTLLACLPNLFFCFSSCSFFDDFPTGSVSLNVESVRSAFSETSGIYIDVELNGGYEDKQTISISSDSPLSVTFDRVPIGTDVFVTAKVYSLYKSEKAILYSGVSETKTISDGDNLFSLKMISVYDNIAQGPYSCLFSKPLFCASSDDRQLKTNRLDFISTDNSFYWRSEKISSYQKLKVTYRKAADTGTSSNISFNLLNTQTNASTSPVTKAITTDADTYELLLPDDAVYDALCITNGAAAGPDNFTCIIDSIELQTVGAFDISGHVNTPDNEDIEVEIKVNGETQTSVDLTQVYGIRHDKTLKLIAEEGFTSYSWKFNGEVKSTTREFSIGSGDSNSVNITTLNYSANPNAIYEITLLADSASDHKSWTLQLKILAD